MKNGLRINWSDEALNNLESILDYLEKNWTERQIKQFLQKIEKTLKIISNHPEGFPKSLIMQSIRRCVLSKQTTIYYKILGDSVIIVSLFDNRQNPEKNLY